MWRYFNVCELEVAMRLLDILFFRVYCELCIERLCGIEEVEIVSAIEIEF